MVTALRLRHLRRYGELGRLLVKYGRSDLAEQVQFDGLDPTLDLDAPPPEAEAEELADDLERLGPTFVKLGQLLSTRPDIVPAAYTKALSRLQDDIAPMPLVEVEQVVREDLGMSPEELFDHFEPEPLASASIGQVHRARLGDGREVVVKVQRLGVPERIAEDLEALGELAELLDRHSDLGRRVGFGELLEQFGRSLTDELDYRREASNLRRMHDIVEPYDRLHVPLPVEEATSRRVLTMDHIAGRKITDLTPVGRTDVDGAVLADQLVRAYLDQVLVEGFFHADPHPGNVLLTDDHDLVVLDLGMVARVPDRFRDALIRLLVAIGTDDGEEAARVTVGLGTPLSDFDEPAFVRGVAALVDRAQGLGMAELDAGTLVLELNRIALGTGLRLPPELSLLGKALLNLDQIAAQLDPSFEPAECIRAHADQVLRQRMQPTRERLVNVALEAREFVEELPGRVNRMLDAVSNGELRLNVEAIDEKELLKGLHHMANRITTGLVLAALIVGAAMLTRVETASTLFGYPALAIVCFLLAAAGAVVLFGSIVVDGRRRNRR
jgi:predicted unusual protein kinase regulating ubiquinone biosynthesis (AarF/ABC1/UbiB family)